MTVIKQVVIPTNLADQKAILAAVKEASNSLIRIEAEKDQVKTIVEDLAEKYEGLNKKFIRKLISVYHKQNFDKVTTEMSEFEQLYTTIVK